MEVDGPGTNSSTLWDNLLYWKPPAPIVFNVVGNLKEVRSFL